MIDRKALLTDLKKQVGALEGDLRERAAEDADIHARLYGEWQQARAASRIAATYESWLDDRVTQAAVAWVLGTVFLRFCEDNGLIEVPFLAGPGERLDLAQERQAEYIRQHPHDTDRDWILAGFAEMSRSPVAAGLFDRAHNPMWQIEIPHHAAKALLAFWRRRGEDGEIVHDFTDPEWDTRFLGDLYQDLSEHAKKTYALLQTPEFVEEFILDYTLEPAVDEFGLAGLRLIDPTCGSGHFLLGAFHRILDKWRVAEPGTDIWELIRRTLLSVHGVDKNPFATNIARFRLLTAVMKAGGVSALSQVPEFPIIVATGDSLLHGRGGPGVQEDLLSATEPHTHATEDIYEFISSDDKVHPDAVDLLGAGSYHVVMGNPPYITVKDKQENANYRAAYSDVCVGQYALSVPFAKRFFQLAILGDGERAKAGYTGQITANSFMKREFGRRLIEQYFPTVDITHIIDTSGAHIPGHGTPTLIIFGRRRWPKAKTRLKAVMGIQGELDQPADPAKGEVWLSIVDLLSDPGSSSEWVEYRSMQREEFSRYPWNLSGGGAGELQAEIEAAAIARLNSYAVSVGRTTATGEDELYFLPDMRTAERLGEREFVRRLVVGDSVRDYRIGAQVFVRNPYLDDENKRSIPESHPLASRGLWPARTLLRQRNIFGSSMSAQGKPWTDHLENYSSKLKFIRGITFSFVSTHNHFAIDRVGHLFNRTAPVVKLSKELSDDESLGLLALLNSSIACFWLKQVCQDRGNRGGERSTGRYPWESYYEFSGARVQDFPIPADKPVYLARKMEALAERLAALESTAVRADSVPTRQSLNIAKADYELVRAKMIALQEEIDWVAYSAYEIPIDDDLLLLPLEDEDIPAIELGERAFEIAMARNGRFSEGERQWFRRHRSSPRQDIPAHWPDRYRDVVEKRIETIGRRPDIALLERPQYKRRWAAESWDDQERSALRAWLLDRCEKRSLWFSDDEHGSEQPRVMTVNQLADQLRRDEDFKSVARLYEGDDMELSKVIKEITQDEHVPYLAALRYKDPAGLRKREQWEDVWRQQREEDRTNKQLDIPLPPRYTSADFLKSSYWRNRGKLDVPKERFISYPESGPDEDSSMLLGWAGWDHREQAQALQTLIDERAGQDGWDATRLTPLLAGLAEVLPWVCQWHGEVDPVFGQSPADAYANFLETKQRELGLSEDDLKKWRPEKPKRGGRRKKTS